MKNGSVSGNVAPNGGGIYTAGGAVNLDGTTVSGNSAVISGGLYVLAGTSTLTDATISNNTATNAGGGIGMAGTVNATGGSITGNTAPSGGGLFNNTGTANLTDVSMTGNNGTTAGGAAYNSPASGKLNVSGGTISNNTGLNGGAVYNTGVTVVDGATMNGNTANGGTTTNGGNGGAVYNTLSLTIKNAGLSGNKVVPNTNSTPGTTGYGGAIVSANLVNNTAPTVTLTDTTIAGGGVSGGNATVGGAIVGFFNLFAQGTSTKITGTNLTLSKNVASAFGGGIFTYGGLSLTGSTLDQNSAALYGAAYVDGTLAPTATIDSTEVTGNTASVAGSGLTFGAGVTAEVRNGSTISGNTSPGGSGIFNGGTLAVKNSHVDGNTASSFGGGIVTTGALTLTDSTVDDNTATVYGGGLSTGDVKNAQNVNVPSGSIAMTGGHVNGNTAGAGGGAFIGNGLTASFSGTDFKNNSATAANSGAGAIASAGKLTVDRAAISGNTANPTNGLGGAIVSGSNDANVATTLKLTNSLLTANSAFTGPAIVAGSADASSTNKTSISNTTIHANTATGPFGAVYVTDPTSIAGSTITDNTAVPTSPFDAYGALLAQSAGQISLSGSILAGNSGHQCNVAVADGGYNLSSPAATDCGLTAGSDLVGAPQLGALANNGGPTQTRLPGPASPALDRITNPTAAAGVTDAISGATISLCPGSDQRGTSRPQGAKCDIGAVEADQVVPTVSGPVTATYVVGSAGGPQTYTSTGSPQATLSATGLPNGVTFHDNGDGTGSISGTPAVGTGGTYNAQVKATNEAGTGTKNVTITVNEAATLSGPSSATYTVGQLGGPDVFHQTGGFPVATLSGTGTPPGGVGFTDNGDGSGQYGGTPATGTGGVYNLGVKASNGTPPDATVGFVLTVKEAASLTGPSSATFVVGTAGASGTFTAGGFPIPTLSATGLPTGLSISGTGSGTIHGTAADNTGGEYDATVIASNGVGANATKGVHLTVNEAPELAGPTSVRFVVGSANTVGFTSTGYPQATVSKTGTPPASLTFTPDGNGGATIHGTALASEIGTYHVTIKAANGVSPDSVISLTLEVVPPVGITTTALPDAAYRTAYTANLGAVGGQPPYTWSVLTGSLPPGLTLNANGMISGSPTVAAGTYIFKVQVSDAADPAQTDTKVLSIKVGKGATTLVVDPVLVQKSGLNIKVGIVSATLTGGFPPQGVSGQVINFYAGTTKVCTGTTDANGRVARCEVNLLNALKVVSSGGVSATYAGNTFWLPSSGSAGLVG
jgi:hypothetical protein